MLFFSFDDFGSSGLESVDLRADFFLSFLAKKLANGSLILSVNRSNPVAPHLRSEVALQSDRAEIAPDVLEIKRAR